MKRRLSVLGFLMIALILVSCPNPATPTPDRTVTLSAIPGVAAPVTGKAPVTTAIDTEQYTGTITWSPGASVFAANTVYTADIVLTAKGGFTLTGVASDSFTVAGATATNAADSGMVAAVFPATSILAMIQVPAGSFRRDAAAANVSVITAGFSMSAYEITMEQFVAVTGLENPSVSFTEVVDGPVQTTNWYHALVFCNELSIAEGRTPAYTISGSTDPAVWGAVPTGSQAPWNETWNSVICDWSADGYRLPTQTEWIWAAMGATRDRANGYTGSGVNTAGYTKGYAGSSEAGGAQSDLAQYAWYKENSGETTRTVGGKEANELGLYDMSGNVLEWCWDWYAAYPSGSLTDYRGPDSGLYRVLTGGSWLDEADGCMLALRDGLGPAGPVFDTIGFRVVRP